MNNPRGVYLPEGLRGEIEPTREEPKRERERWKARPFKGKVAHAHWGFAHAQSPHVGCNAWQVMW